MYPITAKDSESVSVEDGRRLKGEFGHSLAPDNADVFPISRSGQSVGNEARMDFLCPGKDGTMPLPMEKDLQSSDGV